MVGKLVSGFVAVGNLGHLWEERTNQNNKPCWVGWECVLFRNCNALDLTWTEYALGHFHEFGPRGLEKAL